MISCKPGVEFKGFSKGLVKILQELLEVDSPVPIVITSGSDGSHMKNSKHYKFEAVDVRSKSFPSRDSKLKYRRDLLNRLGPKFTVILEGEGLEYEHFHIQVKRGQSYP
jgi:hypothetical protein